MESDWGELGKIQVDKSEYYRHGVVWVFIWWFMVSGGLDAGWPVFFSFWTQSPYVVLYALTYYITLFWTAPSLHQNELRFAGRTAVTVIGYTLLYMGMNRVIPEWEDGKSVFYDYTINSEIEESILILIFIGIPAFGLYYNKINIAKAKRIAHEEVRLSHVREHLAQNKLKLYKSEFNAHLTFNTLSLIYTRALDNSEVAEPILLLSDILRYNTTVEADRVVALSSEITHLQNFIRIHRILYPDIAVEFSVEGEVAHIRVLPRIFINFVENAIKHGAGNNCDYPIRVTLRVDEHIYFNVKNRKRTVFVLQNTTKKGHQITLQTLQAFYGDQFSLEINENEEWYEASLKISIPEDKLLTKQAM